MSELVNGVRVTGSSTTVTDPGGNAYTINFGNLYTPSATSDDVAAISYPGLPATTISFKYQTLPTSPFPAVLTEVDYNGNPYAYTTYITATGPYYGWATSESLADGSMTNTVNYAADASGNLVATITNPLGHQATQNYAGTNGSGGAFNSQLSLVSDTAVQTCSATTHGIAYDANGHVSTKIDNNGNVHTYNYDINGQLQSETEAQGTSSARTTDYVWDSNLQLNRLLSETVEGWKRTTYTYNSQNRLASVAVTNLSGAGSANQTLTTAYNYAFYGNGMVQTMTVTKPSPNGSDVDTYQYDSLGNLTSFSNGLGQSTTYSNYNGLGLAGHVVGPNGDATDYTYDARGRVASKTTYPNGSSATTSYTYDGFGLLYTQTSPDGEVTTWNRDVTMRVTSITRNDKDGTSTESFSYDANGDIIEREVTRSGTVGVDEVFHYDALGRLYQKVGQNGQLLTYAYDGNGNVLSVADAVGHTVTHQYDALDRVSQTQESGGASPVMPASAPAINAPGSNINGAYTVSWTSISGATYYELQEQVNSGGWSTLQSGSVLSWSASGKPNGTYAYRTHGCNVTGCGPWSSVAVVSVLYPPATPSLSAPASNNTGSYTVSWSGVATAASYTLQEQVNGGSWATVQSNTATSWAPTGNANGSYAYQVQACNASGCSAWSAASIVTVLLPPATAPSLSAPANNGSGAYSVSWSAVATSTSYNLQEQVNGGTWTTVQSNAGVAWSAAGKSNGTYAYQVQACNGGGCSAWSALATTVVLLPPGSAPSVNSPSTNSSGSYTVSWSTITNATSYTLQEQLNGGSWTTVQSSGATTWSASGKANGTYGYQAQSCNSGGCSAWSSVSTTVVLHPPVSAPSLSVPANSASGSYTVSWGSVATATTYNLQEQVNGGSWTTVLSGNATSWTASGHGNGSYGYQVQACNSSGCGPWSSAGSATVLLPPASAPGLSVPGSSTNGSYTASWSGVATATSYTLQEQVNGGGWSTIQSNGSTSWGATGRGNGTYGYRVQACNASGCGPWSGVASVNVLWPPGSAPSLSVAARNYAASYVVSWNAVATASSYTLQEQVNGSGWATVQANGATSWTASGHGNATYGYQVQACNASGCGPWSGVSSSIVIIPTPIAANGQSYDNLYVITSGTATSSIGFDIANGNTWEVFKYTSKTSKSVMASGAIPPGAVTVQYTWTYVGVPASDTSAGGTVTNGASSPTGVGSNPSSNYTTGSASYTQGSKGQQYTLRVDFFDANGVNVSSSTFTMIAETQGQKA
ncbi:RHS repeat protein [Dyella sp. ASV21]|uniref:RHS repeat protein n=1 Tax=Dyella sp. ASV21 TaxID=2795114 RepID=UPI0018ED8DF9